MRVLGGLGHREHRGGGHVLRLADLHDLGLGALHGPALDHGVDEVLVLPAHEHVAEHLGLRPLGVAHHLAKAVPLAGLEHQHPDVAVLAGQDRRRRGQPHADAGATVVDAVLGVATDVLTTDESGRDRLGTRHVHVLAAAHAPPPVGGGQAPRRCSDGAVEVGREGAVLQGCLAGTAAVAVAGRRHVEGVEVAAVPVAVRTRPPERRDRDQHQIGVGGAQRRVVEALLVDPGGPGSSPPARRPARRARGRRPARPARSRRGQRRACWC